MKLAQTIEENWSHFGRDPTGGGASETEILERAEAALREGRFDEAREIVAEAKSIADSYGYGEADGFLSHHHEIEDTEYGQALKDAYDSATTEGDYADRITSTHAILSEAFSDGEAQEIVGLITQAMREGYAEGRKTREGQQSTPAPTPKP